MFEIKVGRPYIPNSTCFKPGVHFNFSAGIYQLLISINNLKKIEKKSITKGKGRFKIFTYRDILFLLYKFNPGFDWSDCPYHFSRVARDARVEPQDITNETEGIGLSIVLIEANTGIVEGIRLIKLKNKLSREIVDIIKHQVENPISDEEYHRRIDSAYRYYPSTESMLKLNLRNQDLN